MSTQSDTMPDTPLDRPAVAAALSTPTRPFYWSVRRELWENRSIYIAPLVAAGVVLFGFILSMIFLPRRIGELEGMTPDKLHAIVVIPYAFAAAAVLVTAFIVAVFYCLAALNTERRDRSILFWKSLPVSDLTTVLSKAFIPLVVLPIVTYVVVVALQLVMVPLNSAGLAAAGLDASIPWTDLPLIHLQLLLLYALAALALWHAPLYGWLLLVSGWAKRAPFLWAVLPPLALSLIEKLAFNTGYLGHMFASRIWGGGLDKAFVSQPHHMRGEMGPLPQIDLIRFLSSPGLWIGLVVAAAFIAAAIWQRRYREPV